jgi:two-component system response regulator NreC
MPSSPTKASTATASLSTHLRILLVDDHAVVREGLRLLINTQADMEVVGEADDGSQVLQQAKALQPDVVIMDISMPQLNGVQATERLKAAYPRIKILVLSSYSDEAHIRQALASGASSYVLKRTIAEELIRAIRTVMSGGVYLDPSIAGMVVNGYANNVSEEKRIEQLSKREHEVLLDVAYGYTNKEVADRLHMSVKTVEGHKARIREKLNLATRAEIVRYALHQGWLQDD